MASISAGSQFIAFMDHDDVWLPDALAVLRDTLARIQNRSPRTVWPTRLTERASRRTTRVPTAGLLNFGRKRMACENGRLVPLDLSKPTTFASLYPISRLFPLGLVIDPP
jgi:hypothetical protein